MEGYMRTAYINWGDFDFLPLYKIDQFCIEINLVNIRMSLVWLIL